MALNLKGADGNANVTRYLFPGHDFEIDYNVTLRIYLTEQQFLNSAWRIYLGTSLIRYHVPGYGSGGNTMYRVFERHYGSGEAQFVISSEDGPGEDYSRIEIIRIESSETVDMRKQKSGDSIIPDHLDISNYDEVAEYYGFYK
ncbi:MAG: hypothetical protein ACQEST_11650 [Bacteroidota bacterium]